MIAQNKPITFAIAGNPNCGKTALFNALTGAHQTVGNWPGVTVDKKEGSFEHEGQKVHVVDLPGIYALFANSEDESAALGYLLTGEANAVIDIIDATNLERNLFLTTQLLEMGVPVIIALNMIDIATRRGIHIDDHALSEKLGVPVLALSAVSPKSCESFKLALMKQIGNLEIKRTQVPHAPKLETLIAKLAPKMENIAKELHSTSRWAAIQYLESNKSVISLIKTSDKVPSHDELEKELGEDPTFAIADARYSFIREITNKVIRKASDRVTNTDKLDKLFLNRFLGIPLFLIVMYLIFWVTITFGSAFIDFFDILFGAIFVDGFGELLASSGAPAPLVALLAGGLGTGIQTLATFIPPIFFMFLCLAILEDSGYMARAAFVMDKFMTFLGLPGKAFVPMLMGFGCSVPAIMGAKTMENKRDRFLSIFLIPFMSCGARLPVYALFCVAFFGKDAGKVIFGIYMLGLLVGLLYGLFLKHSLFKGKPTSFIMELPPYHAPRLMAILSHAWLQLKEFLFRAGKIVLIMVTILGFFSSLGVDGSFGNANNEKSILAKTGKAISPIFEPLGVERDNWPASVALFTGLFAKEAIVGTLQSLYGIEESDGKAQNAEENKTDLGASIKTAVLSIPHNLVGIIEGFAAPFSSKSEIQNAQDEIGTTSILSILQSKFDKGKFQVFAYLLFILLYVPCLAALGTAFRALGTFYGIVLAVFQTVLGWSMSVLFFQVTVGHEAVWIITSIVLLALVAIGLLTIGKKKPMNT
ncbi:MAG: ferrous iron transport protein B [Fibrobacteraceae bacterium]|nr:ferrous iron transport protein B [Fibrobacteraceae bacterium]